MPTMTMIMQPPDDDQPAMPLLAAQEMELRSRWRSAQRGSDLKPGDIVVEKQGLGHGRRGRKSLLIVWRMLDRTDWIDQETIKRHIRHDLAGTDRPDCMVAEMAAGGAVLSICCHQLSQLELWDGNTAEDIV